MDPAAVMCTGAGGGIKYFANTKAVPFTTCGAGYNPITYANGTAITGAYLSPLNNNPTVTGTAAAPISFTTPGLAVFEPVSMLGGHLQFTWPNVRLYLGGTYRPGIDRTRVPDSSVLFPASISRILVRTSQEAEITASGPMRRKDSPSASMP